MWPGVGRHSIMFVKDRPDFGALQVRCPHQIKMGFSYIDVTIGDTVIITCEPYFDRTTMWFEVDSKSCPWYAKRSLSDRNIIPYENGIWNSSNWLKFADSNPFRGERECKECRDKEIASMQMTEKPWRHSMELLLSVLGENAGDLGKCDSYKTHANRWSYWQWKISPDETLVDMLCNSAPKEILQAVIETNTTISNGSATIYCKGIKNLIDRLGGRRVRSILSNGWWCLEVEPKKN